MVLMQKNPLLLRLISVSRSSTCDILPLTRKRDSSSGLKVLPLTRGDAVSDQLEQTLTAYDIWLERQPLASSTRNAYRLQVHQYGAYLTQRTEDMDDPLSQPFARDYAVRDYKTYLKTERKVKPTSVNLALAAIDHFYQFLGSDRPKVQREDLPEQSPRALKPEEQTA